MPWTVLTSIAPRTVPHAAIVCLASVIMCSLAAAPPDAAAQQSRLYLANDDHTDYMWTADAATYDRVFSELIDFHLALTKATRDKPAPFQNRFNLDGSYWLWSYQKNRTPEEFQRVLDALKSGHLSAPLNALVSCYGAQPTEAVLRGMYYPGQLERRHGLRFTQAVAMENQTLPLGLASLWAGAGAKYSWKGVCSCASKLSLGVRKHEIYWWTGPDDQRVLMKWHTKAGPHNRSIGGYAEAFDPEKAIQYLAADADFLRRYRAPGAKEPYQVRGAFGFGWDALDRKTAQSYLPNPTMYPEVNHFHLIAQAQTTVDRRVIVSNQEDFFRDFEEHYGSQLPTESVTYGNEWDLYSASMAETSARVRRAVEKLRPAEALATLVSLQRPDFLRGREAARDLACINLGLYWEHDWTADGPVPREARAAWQEKLAGEIESYADTLHGDALAQLSGLIENHGDAPRFFAFNPLGWPRTDAADFRYDGPEDIHVRDLAADTDAPHQIEKRGDQTWLRVLAREVPAVGYKVFEIRRGPGTSATDAAATVSGPRNRVVENSRVKLTLQDDGAIAGLIDKAHPAHNLAARIDGLTLNDLSTNSSGRRGITIEHSGPVSVTLQCISDSGRNHTTRITLVRDSERVAIHNEITENLGDLKHWAFSFNLAAPVVHTEELGAIIKVKKKADGGDYADENARYDYATLNHFADISDGANTRGVTLSNADCSFVKLGHSTPQALDHTTAQLQVLAGGQVDGESLGIRNQNVATYFLQRFALRPHGGYDPVLAMKFAVEHQNPLVTGTVRGGNASPYPATSFSLLKVSDPGVLLWTLKPAEEGISQGLIARVWNLNSAPADLSLSLHFRGQSLTSAQQTTHIETDLGAVPVTSGSLSAHLAPQQLRTFRLLIK